MPTVTQEKIEGFAHCEDSLCPGNEQQPVKALRERADFTYAEKGGDAPGVENSATAILFAVEKDRVCPECGKDRAVADQVRPVYPSMVAGSDGRALDQRFLLKLAQDGKIVAPGQAKTDDEVAELRRELAELRGFMAGQAQAATKGKPVGGE